MLLQPASRSPFRLMALITAVAILTVVAITAAAPLAPAFAASARQPRPNLAAGTAYLVSPAHLIGGHYYQTIPRFADFGLTIDGALALAATGDDNQALKKIVSFIAGNGRDQSGKTASYWSGIGTRFASGGAIGKEALLAEVVGDNPRGFGGHDLIAALDATVCRQASAGANGPCAGPGSYSYATSVFDQALGIMAQVRAGDVAAARAPIAFLERLRNADGSFPSIIPDSHDHDVDSTAIAVMALALVRTQRARADVAAGLAWIAGQQERAGGFRGVTGVSVNSAGLAIQALTMRSARYRSQIRLALAFLAREQNSDGGFRAFAGGQGESDVRASAQAVGGATGISFGTLSRDLGPGSAVPAESAHSLGGSLVVAAAVIALVALVTLALWLRRRRLVSAAAFIAIVGLTAIALRAGSPAVAAGRPVGDCTAASGATLVVDFGHWGGPLLRACGSTPTTGYSLLNQGGWHTSGTEHDGPGFVCRIGYAGYHHGTQYPTAAQEPCVNTPPATAYWTYWQAGPGQNTWHYSQAGAATYHPRPGSISLWIFGGTNISGTTGSAVPSMSPAGLRRSAVGAPPVAASGPRASGSSAPALAAVAIAAVLTALGVVASRRRRRQEQVIR